MKTHSIKYDTSLKQGYKSNPAITKKEYSAGLCENNNRGYSVAFSGSGASTSEAAAKFLKLLEWKTPNKFVKSEIGNYTFDIETYSKTKRNFINKLRLDNPEKYKYGEYGQYPKYESNMNETFWGRILGSKRLHKIGEYFDSKPSVGQAFTSLLVAGILRPATNLAMAGKEDREDSMYAASHAIASAVIGYIVSATVLKPFDDAFKQIVKDPEKHLAGCETLLDLQKIGKRRIETSVRWDKISQMCKMSFDTFILGIPKAMLTIALIPPILKYVFGMEKKPKKDIVNTENNNIMPNLINKAVFAEFKGGVK